MLRVIRAAVVPLALLSCTQAPRPPHAPAPAISRSASLPPPEAAAPREPLAWADLTPETFARAKAERRFIVLDGAAEWCHWCHVMEATTYHDAEVAKLLAAKFIAVKVDVDARPDIEERYGEYGWPATVIFSPDAEELGKYRGYIAPEKFAEILRDIVAARPDGASPAAAPSDASDAAAQGALGEEHLAWILRMTELELDDYYDGEHGGWGRSQKSALASNNAWAIERVKAGDVAMKKKLEVTLDKQRALIDPVWGGIYQYSAAPHWNAPHFEKLMTFQAGALDNYAAAYALTKDARWLEAAKTMRAFIDRFMTAPDGTFYTTQDADLNAHDRTKPFVDGHAYYALDEARRLALGIPRVDTHAYAKENGLAIAAYASLYEATGDASALASAKKAADRILATHETERGGVTHDAKGEKGADKLLYLSDNAFLGWGLLRLHEASHDGAYLARAKAIGDFLIKELGDERGGGFFASTVDANAAGIFARRHKPYEENVMAARFLAKLARAVGVEPYRHAIAETLRVIAAPDALHGRGRMLGDVLLALVETRGVR